MHDPSRAVGVGAVARFGRRLPRGQSDPVGPPTTGTGGGDSSDAALGGLYSCGCDPAAGAIVLFYAYTPLSDPGGVVKRLKEVCEGAGVTGKLRIAAEGINGTAAGTAAGIRSLVAAMRADPDASLAAAAAAMDFKPAPGCAHLFDSLSVRLVPEIVPFQETGGQQTGPTGQRQRQRASVVRGDGRGEETRMGSDGKSIEGTNDGGGREETAGAGDPVPVGYVDPLEFHRIVEAAKHEREATATDDDNNNGSCGVENEKEDGKSKSGSASGNTVSNTVIVDVRNWYESRVGHFEGAVLAPLRRFSQFPEFVAQHRETFAEKDVVMYCTGGIRCEKAAQFLAGLPVSGAGAGAGAASGVGDGGGGRPASVRQLRGGIVAYARDVLGQSDAGGSVELPPHVVGVGGGGGGENMELEKKENKSSMFRGCNFVFDNRGAVRVSDAVGLYTLNDVVL